MFISPLEAFKSSVERDKISENNLKEYCQQRLTQFKIPRKILIVKEIPKGATGKLQRIGLYKKLGIK